MNQYENKKYEAMPLPLIRPEAKEPARKREAPQRMEQMTFAEIEIAGDEIKNAPASDSLRGNFIAAQIVYTPRSVFGERKATHEIINERAAFGEPPVFDERRRLFAEMRQIMRDEAYAPSDHAKLFYQRDLRGALARVFYKQAHFMRDYEDDYEGYSEFFSYYPHYQLMNYEQCRSYFAWRAKFRAGDAKRAPLSFVYMHAYELINLIGVTDAADGLAKLTRLWLAFREREKTVDKYFLRWIKDFHVFYDLPKTFAEYLHENELENFFKGEYSEGFDVDDYFRLFAPVSKYDVTRSPFYQGENKNVFERCFNFVIAELRNKCADKNIFFDFLLYKTPSNKTVWHPFDGALFYDRFERRERRLALSADDIYFCRNGTWHNVSRSEGNKNLIGYITKQTEASLRAAGGFKQKLAANANMIDKTSWQKFYAAGIKPDELIEKCVADFYARLTRVSVEIDSLHLEKIRRESLDTQEKLTVAQEETIQSKRDAIEVIKIEPPTEDKKIFSRGESDRWKIFYDSLSETQKTALRITQSGGDVRAFLRENSLMPEILADEINGKAAEAIGDNLIEFDGGFIIYDEYAVALSSLLRE